MKAALAVMPSKVAPDHLKTSVFVRVKKCQPVLMFLMSTFKHLSRVVNRMVNYGRIAGK